MAERIISERSGQAVTIGIIVFMACVWPFEMSWTKSLLFATISALCVVYGIGGRRLGQVSVMLLLLTAAVASELVPPVKQWRPTLSAKLGKMGVAQAEESANRR